MTQQTYIEKINDYLLDNLPTENPLYADLTEAIRYSIVNGGKRVRPILAMESCRLCGGNIDDVLPFACAVEMIHSYSLVHDDLPCMDNDDIRRGLPSTHKKFGEDIALLAGDAMISLAFSFMLSPKNTKKISTQQIVSAAYALSLASGTHGMVGGQVIDLQSEGKVISLEVLEQLQAKKTGAMIRCAGEIGCIIAGATQEQSKSIEKYSRCIGLAFQVVDDILDVVSSTEKLGKPIGSDATNEKSTYVSIFGIEKAKEIVDQLTEQAINAVSMFGSDAEFLVEMAKNLSSREL